MNVRLNPGSGVPIYRQIVDQIGYGIASGRLQPGDRLPSVRELARDLPANQNTILKAYDLLERDGYLVRRHGEGTFVADGSPSMRLSERRRVVREALAHAVAKAAALNLSPQELHVLLDAEVRRVPQLREAVHE